MHVVHESFVLSGRHFKRGERIDGEIEREVVAHPFFRQMCSRVHAPAPPPMTEPAEEPVPIKSRREAKAEE